MRFMSAKDVVLPIMLAVVLKLLLQPTMDFLRNRLRLPAAFAALLLIICLFVFIATVLFAISGPASAWISKLPEVLPLAQTEARCSPRTHRLLAGMFKELEEVAASSAQGASVPTVAVKDPTAITSKLAWSTISILTRLLSTFVILFFLLAAGDRLLREPH